MAKDEELMASSVLTAEALMERSAAMAELPEDVRETVRDLTDLIDNFADLLSEHLDYRDEEQLVFEERARHCRNAVLHMLQNLMLEEVAAAIWFDNERVH